MSFLPDFLERFRLGVENYIEKSAPVQYLAKRDAQSMAKPVAPVSKPMKTAQSVPKNANSTITVAPQGQKFSNAFQLEFSPQKALDIISFPGKAADKTLGALSRPGTPFMEAPNFSDIAKETAKKTVVGKVPYGPEGLAFGVMLTADPLNFFGGGAGKATLPLLAKYGEKELPKIVSILKKAGVADDLVDDVARQVVKADTVPKVETILRRTADLQQFTKVTPIVPKKLGVEKLFDTSAISLSIGMDATQTADLVRTFQGLKSVLPQFQDGDEFAKAYELASRLGRLSPGDAPPRMVQLVNSIVDSRADSLNFNKIGKAVGLDSTDEFGRDFFNQWKELQSTRAVSSVPKNLEPLAQEARKYKSAEEFLSEHTYLYTDAAPSGSRVAPVDFGQSDLTSVRAMAGSSPIRQTVVPVSKLEPKIAGGRRGLTAAEQVAEQSWFEPTSRKTFPAPTVELRKDGTFKILDGNHRVTLFQEQGYDYVPVNLVDKSGVVDAVDKLFDEGKLQYIDDLHSYLTDFYNQATKATTKAGKPPLPPGIVKITARGVPITEEFATYAEGLKDLGKFEYSPVSVLDPVRAANKLDGVENGLIKKTLIDPVLRADNDLIVHAEDLQQRVSKLAGGIKSGSLEDRLIRQYGERNIYPEFFSADDAAKVTPRIKQAAEGLREIYDELLEQVNRAKKLAGQKEVPKRADYFTHAEQMGVLTSLFGDIDKIPGAMLRAAPFTKPNASFFKFGLPRFFRKTDVGAIEGFERYIQAALPTIHYAPPLVNLRGHIPYLPPRASAYFQDFANDLAGKKAALDRPFPDVVLRIADKLRQLTSQGSILGNLSTAFLQPSSVASTISRAGLSNTIKALPETFTDTGIEFAEKYSKTLRGRTYDPDINPKVLGSVKNMMGWGLQTLDRMVVRNSFLANFKHATRVKKLPFEEAVKYADDLAQKTQATNRKILMPPLMRSKVGGTAGQLQTFTINLYNQIRRDLPIIRKEQGMREAVKAAMYLGVSAVAINQIYKAAGLPEPYQITTFVPFVGSAKYGEPTPALQGVWGGTQAVFGSGDTRAEGIERLKKFGISLVPGGRQAQKVIQGAIAVSEGGSRTKGGKLRFPIQGPAEKARAFLFGPNQTKAARKYYESKK